MDRHCLGLTTNTISPARHEEASSSEHTVGLEVCVGSVQSLHASPMQRLGITSGVRIRQLGCGPVEMFHGELMARGGTR